MFVILCEQGSLQRDVAREFVWCADEEPEDVVGEQKRLERRRVCEDLSSE